MTHKGIVNLVDATIEKIRAAKGLKPGPVAKGGEIEVANGAFFSAYRKFEAAILAECGVQPAAPVDEG